MKRLLTSSLLAFSMAFLLTGCVQKEVQPTPIPTPRGTLDRNTPGTSQDQVSQAPPPPGAFTLTSSAFQEGQPLPVKYTCDGEDQSPPLQWTDPPSGTKSFTLLVDDPDARGFVHWILYNLPPETRALPENVPTLGELPDGSRQGSNGFGKAGYGGPCPPRGTHRYSFRLYALDRMLDVDPEMDKSRLDQAMAQHVLAQTELAVEYTRK